MAYSLDYISNLSGAIYTPTFEHGQQWVSSYDLKLEVATTSTPNIAPASVYASRLGGQIITYTLNNSVYVSDGDITDTLTRTVNSDGSTSGWIITNASDDSKETYSSIGQLLTITNRAGFSLMMGRDGYGRLEQIFNALGQRLSFTYDNYSPKPHISKVTLPDNSTTQFSYDGNNNLSNVTWADSKVRQYLYENSGLPHSLTGIIDENSNRFATWGYDTQGRVYNSTLAEGASQITLSYNIASTDITDSLGTVRTMGISTILNQVHNTGITQPAGSGCSASALSLTYDVNGNVSSRNDFNGNKSTYVYDLRNLETSRTEGLTSTGAVTPGTTRSITTTWHTSWHLPLQINEYIGGANSSGTPTSTTPFKQTTYTYDTKGNLSSLAITDPALGVTRTTTITNTYSTTVPGLILTKVVNGPRTDVSDISTYTYYPHNATCVASTSGSTVTNLGCRGQLKTLTNELGQITTYDRYNHHGQLEKMTDPNGLITTNTYDARQRLLTQTVGALTTSLQYDGVGQVTRLTLPDSSYLNYTYDAAHRLIGIADILNNTVTYTLDTEGNRISEQLKDPSGNLTKTLTRSYDALNRLQQLTGVGAQ
ncbi:RHS repeat protein [Methylovorus sp. MM2]|uniref:RHS repeat protein n=1 Tax=Methylovorus sp. MM2 TaxID=1848038 RepID=UPI0013F4EAC0|nr:RHS repeat protein [Methylovorus sp. MM2]